MQPEYRVKEVSQLFNLSLSSIYAMIWSGKLRAHKGKASPHHERLVWWVRGRDVERWLEQKGES